MKLVDIQIPRDRFSQIVEPNLSIFLNHLFHLRGSRRQLHQQLSAKEQRAQLKE